MGVRRNQSEYIDVAVHWGNSELGRYQKRLSSCSRVRAGRGFLSNIRTKIWPLPKGFDIVVKRGDQLILNPKITWDGVFYDGNSITILNSSKPQSKIFVISHGASATLRFNHVTVLIRVGKLFNARNAKVAKKSGFRSSMFSFVAEQPIEWAALSIGLVASGLLLAPLTLMLLKSHPKRLTTISQLSEDRLLPYIGQDHLATAPNVLQFGLDRFRFIHNVWSFYEDLAVTLGFNEDPGKQSQVFSSTIEYYQELGESQTEALTSAEDAQRKKIYQPGERGRLLSIPTVLGESIDGKTLRVLDKIKVIKDSADELVKKRVDVATRFSADIGYKFEQKPSPTSTTDAFAKISAGFMGVESDDKMQAQLASDSAAKAALEQSRIFGKDRLRFGPVDCCSSPSGMPLTQDGISWIKPQLRNDQRSSITDGGVSTWGNLDSRQSPIINEPKSGTVDPASIEKTVAAGRYQLRLCYELALRRNQGARGSMEWRWIIDSQGQTSDLNLVRSSIKDEELVKCVREKIASWRFPRPKGGSVEIRYPFEFSKDKG